MAILLAFYTATIGIGASVAPDVTFTTTPDLRAELGSTACVIAITPKVLDSKYLAHRSHRRGLEGAEEPDAWVVDEHVDGPTRLERGRDAFGLRHVSRLCRRRADDCR